MKKIFLSFLLCLPVFAAFAQRYDYNEDAPQPHRNKKANHPGVDVNRLRFGVFVAPTIAWMQPTASKSDDGQYFVSNKGTRAGFAWGLMGDYYFAPNYGISFGFNLNSTGGRITTAANPAKVNLAGPNTVLNTDFSYKLQYLEIPVALKLRSDGLGGSGIRIFGQVGLALAINVSRKVSYDVLYRDGGGNPLEVSGDNEKLQGALAISPVMLEMNLGAGIEYPLTPKMSFYTGFFFNNGFLPDATYPENYQLDYSGTFKDGNVRLNNCALRVGVFF